MTTITESDHLDRGRRASLACPHCAGALRVRSSRSVTSTYRQLNLVCFDPECGATFGAELSITHAISPSARPNPAVQLRSAPPRSKAAANDTAASVLPVAANDSGPEVPRAAANDDEPSIATG